MNSTFDYLSGSLCISFDAAARALGGDISAKKTIQMGMYRNRQYPQSYISHPDPADARRKWIVVDSLPATVLKAVERTYGSPASAYYRTRFQEAIAQHTSDRDTDHLYQLLRSGMNLTPARIEQLTLAAAALRVIASDFLRDHFDTQRHYYNLCIEMLDALRIPALSISNVRVLGRKVASFRERGIDSLISGRYENSNSRKLTPTQINFIINSYSLPIKLSIREVWRQYMSQAADRGWEQISEERCRQIIMDPAHVQLWMLSRDGEISARNKLERTVLRKRPSFPDALWSLDGLTIQLRYSDRGQVRSELYAVIVLDIFSDRIVGWAIGTTETSTLVQAAMRSAGRNTMQLPYQIQYDNSSANISAEVQELMSRLSHHHFPTQPYNGKSKPVENLIGRLEGLVLRHYANFKGGNITSHSMAIKANPDYLERQRRDGSLPSEEAVRAQFELAVRVHNATRSERDGMTPDERYSIDHPQRRRLDYLTIVDAFWVTRRDQARYTKDGLTIEVNKERHIYEVEASKGVEDMEFRRQYLGSKFTLKYDPDELSVIHLYHDDVWIAMASEKFRAPMALADREEGDGAIIHEALEQRRGYLDSLRADRAAMQDQLQAEGLPVDLDFNILHKDAFNRIEQHILDDLLDRAAVRPVASRPQPAQRIKAPVDLYDDTEADGSVINTNY